MKYSFYIICVIFYTIGIQNSYGWGSSNHKKVLLKNVDSLTLYDGKMTNGRRSSPVPQLACTNEGSASCYDYKPKIVQCTNRGFDGLDTQWECKSDMDSRYKFGFIEVTCEGYDYPDDPYILAGSCGLKYTLDHASNTGDYNKGHDQYGSSYNSYKRKSSMSNSLADIIAYGGIALMIYALYKTCFRSTRNVGDNAYSTTNDDDPPSDSRGGGYGWFGGDNSSSQHRPSSSSYNDDASCGRNRGSSQAGQGRGSGLGGFWTGAATGGLLGYMFGGGQNSYGGYNSGYGGRSYGYGGRPYGSGGGMFSGGGGGWSGSSGGYSGTRTSTGFGGTSRR